MSNESGRTVIEGVRVMGVDGQFSAPTNVTLRGGMIESLDASPHGSDVVDGRGSDLLPGLFDCHVHVTHPGADIVKGLHRPFSYQYFEAVRNLELILACGITSIRDAGGADLGVARALDDQLITGPRAQLAIQILSQTGGHNDGWCVSGNTVERSGLEHPGRPHGIIDGVDEARKKVRQLKRAGADWIKVCSSGGVLSVGSDPMHPHLRPDELAECVAEAAASGTGVMCHAASTVGIKNAVRAGVRSIEHGIYLDDEAIGLMIDRGTWLVPTLSAPRALIDMADQGVPIQPRVLEKAQSVVESHRDSFRRAYDAGVRIAMGTDSGVGPHGANLDELTLMAEAGMPVADVLRAATISAAELMGVSDTLGSIEVGKRADLLMVRGPLKDFRDMKSRIQAVYMDGRLVHETGGAFARRHARIGA